MKTGAYRLALMSQAAYHPDESYPLLPKFVWNFATTEYVEIRVEGSTGYIVFRGSDDTTDWLRNADAHFRAVPRGAIHHGLLKGWLELGDAVKIRLSSLDVDKIVITGHSRGGALAIQCHELLDRTRPDLDVSTVTFGCPRFCDGEFESWCDWDRLLDIVNYMNGWCPFFQDPVPHIPVRMQRPGEDIYLWGFGRPDRMHRIGSYVNRLGR